MKKKRAEHGCEVLVIGSGVSGLCAAIQCGRLGCRTVLVEKDDVLGGNAGPNLGVGITGADRYSPYATDPGIIHQIHERAAWVGAFTQCSAGNMGYSISRRFEALLQEFLRDAGVTVLKRHYARQPEVAPDGRIVGVLCEDLAAFRSVRIAVSGMVVEASGDGEIGALAGADFEVGSEARGEFGERSAPGLRSSLVQGTSLVGIARRTDREVTFVPPAGTPEFIPRVWHGAIRSFVHHHDGWLHDRKDLHFLYVTETGGNRDTIRDDGEIYEDLLGQFWAVWDHIKNGPHREEARNWDLLWISPKAGKRESRRFLGDLILTQTDLEEGRLFPDDIAWGGHDLDDHRPLGEGSNVFAYSIPPVYGIPLRACYSRNVPNLFLGGRLISATHLAHASSRVMRTGGAIGQAVGYAAALCCRHGCTPRALRERHLDELLAGLLSADGAIPGKAMHAAGDLAPRARISATSELLFNRRAPTTHVPLIAPAGVVLWDWSPEMGRIEWCLRNPTSVAQTLILHVFRARRERKWKSLSEFHRHRRNNLEDDALRELAAIPVELPAGFEDWLSIDLPESLELTAKDVTCDDDRLLLALSENAAVELALSGASREIAEMVEHSHHAPVWTPVGAGPAVRLYPPPFLGDAANVINGRRQRFARGPTNMWMSDPADGLPQTLTLHWAEPQRFDEVALTFDNLTADWQEYPWDRGPRVLPHLVKSYTLECEEAGGWRELVVEECNAHRFRVHRFEPVVSAGLRLRIMRTHGSGFGARVYEVRVRKE